jgi:hypothetical protein
VAHILGLVVPTSLLEYQEWVDDVLYRQATSPVRVRVFWIGQLNPGVSRRLFTDTWSGACDCLSTRNGISGCEDEGSAWLINGTTVVPVCSRCEIQDTGWLFVWPVFIRGRGLCRTMKILDPPRSTRYPVAYGHGVTRGLTV